MPEDERAGRIDFTVGQSAVAGPDEELVEPGGGRPDRDRARSPRRALVVGAAVLAGAALAARGFGHDNAPSRPAVDTSSAAVSDAERPAPPIPGTTTPVRLATSGSGAGARWCPEADDGMPACSSEARVPAPVLAALRDRFPAARSTSAYEELLRDVGLGPGGVWYRELHARQGRRTIAVEVRRLASGSSVRVVKHVDARESIVAVTRAARGYTVRVRVTGPSGRALPTRAVLAFAADPRLRATD